MKNRFTAVRVAKALWAVRVDGTGPNVENLNWRTREEARAFARSQNVKEHLRTAEIKSIDGEPLADYSARQARMPS